MSKQPTFIIISDEELIYQFDKENDLMDDIIADTIKEMIQTELFLNSYEYNLHKEKQNDE